MAWFEYEGLTPGGTTIAGRLEADNHDEAMAALGQMQIQVRELRAAGPLTRPAVRLAEEDLIFFNEQLVSLSKAGIALDEGLAQLARDIESPRLRRWIEGLVDDLRSGCTLDQALARHEQGLPVLYSRVVRAGIETGNLPATLLNLNQHLRLVGETRRIIWETASYPILVLILAMGVVSLVMILIMPKMKEIFMDFGTVLPGLTVMLIRIADSYPAILLGVIAVLLGMVLCWQGLRWSEGGRGLRERLVLSLPLFGRIKRNSLIARFVRGVSTAIATGLPLSQAMRLGADATGSPLLKKDIERVVSETEAGQPILAACRSARLVPSLFGFCIQTANGADAVRISMAQLARSYEDRAIHAQGMLRVLLLPAMMIILAAILGTVIVAIFLPMVSLINSVTGGF